MDSLGDGLTVIIHGKPTHQHNWMAFASWYSCYVNLPDANVIVGIRRPLPGESFREYPWLHRTRTLSFQYTSFEKFPKSDLVIPAGTMVVAPPEPNLEIRQAKDEEPGWLVSFSEGCGRFVSSSWIDREGHPFGHVAAYERGDLTVNERRVLSLWKRISPIFDSIG